jgi:hypothetical protein
MKNLINIFSLLLIINFFAYSQTNKNLSLYDNKTQVDTIFIMKKSAWGAVLRSAIIPGLGQIYNESYWKAPLIWGLTGWFVYNWIELNNLYIDNKNLFQQYKSSIFRLRRDFYRDQRDKFAIYIGLLYFLNLVDAYVDAHLYDFYIENNYRNDFQLNFRINF